MENKKGGGMLIKHRLMGETMRVISRRYYGSEVYAAQISRINAIEKFKCLTYNLDVYLPENPRLIYSIHRVLNFDSLGEMHRFAADYYGGDYYLTNCCARLSEINGVSYQTNGAGRSMAGRPIIIPRKGHFEDFETGAGFGRGEAIASGKGSATSNFEFSKSEAITFLVRAITGQNIYATSRAGARLGDTMVDPRILLDCMDEMALYVEGDNPPKIQSEGIGVLDIFAALDIAPEEVHEAFREEFRSP